MELPKVRDIRSKLSSAKLLGVVVKNSLQFKLRRTAMKRFSSKEFDTIVVDMDGTLYKSDVSLEGLKEMFGDSTGAELYESIISKIASGKCSIEKAILEGNSYLIKKKMSKKDFKRVFERIKPGIRKSLVKALKKMKEEGKTIVLATLSSKEFGEILNTYLKKEFGFSFDHVIGTKLKYNSESLIVGVESIVGTKDFEFEGIIVKTKLTSLRDALASDGKELDLGKAVLITDSYGDIDVAKMFVTILIKPKKPTTSQKVSQRLKLADYIIPDNRDLQKNLESIILGPEKELDLHLG